MSMLGFNPQVQGPGPLPQQISEQEQQASHTVAMQLLGIVDDTLGPAIARSITTDENYRSGHFNSQASRPSLPISRNLHLGELGKDVESNSWQAPYEELIGQLPDDAKERFNQEMQKPFDERSYLFVSLDNLLQAAAKFLVKIEELPQAPQAGSAPFEREVLYQAQPYIASQQALFAAQQMSSQLTKIQQQLGPNHPQYAALAEEQQMVKEFTDTLHPLLDKIFKNKGEVEEGDVEQMRGLVGQLAADIEALEGRRGTHEASEALIGQLKASHMVLSSISEGVNGSPSLQLSRSVASIGLQGNDEGSAVDANLSLAIEQLTRSLTHETGKQVGAAQESPDQESMSQESGLQESDSQPASNQKAVNQKGLHTETTAAFLIGCSALGRSMATQGLGKTPEKEPLAVGLSRFYDLQLTMQALLASGLPQQLIGGATGQQPEGPIADSMIVSGSLMSAVAFSGGNKDQIAFLLGSLHDHLNAPLQRMGERADGALEQAALNSDDSEEPAAMSQADRSQLIDLQVAQRSSKEGSSEGLAEALLQIAQRATGGADKFEGASKRLGELIDALIDNLGQTGKEKQRQWHGAEVMPISG